MRVVELSDGRLLRVGVAHDEYEGPGKRRGTRVRVSLENHGSRKRKANAFDLEAEAVCSAQDNFCKREGRRLAVTRLLNELNKLGLLNKEDRRAIFLEVCPEYAGHQSNTWAHSMKRKFKLTRRANPLV